ncbi:efflux RND transporter periplasmic adaptor subunit [Curvibacter sp. CHRR-16]|uniref:efflux RND transporter periplasmic adaptor subunit n=1 Tax=Curvibacter sp. CHRR-16 TaxID=2835872 RepID=UPI001BDB2ED7|nr:efflux RND transporter periplasmic adaptor subunit [Curvibacter sp. CHRR-16]MBT0571633.1 efflux RND transporter periplasmic adaptor subunit [Curvibacter sp. CHRR-16]
MKRWFTLPKIILAVVVMAIAAVLLQRWLAPAPNAPQVNTSAVDKGNLEETVLATGTFAAIKQVNVGARVSGQIKTLRVKLGDAVKKGDLIAEIDSTTQENTLRDAQASLQSAQAVLKVKQTTLRQAELTAKRQRDLLAAQAGTQADVETAEAALDTARAELTAQEATVQQARITVDTAQANLAYCTITAPMDGTIVAVAIEQGQTVNANQSSPTIVKLAQLGTMLIKAKISEADIPRVKPGMRATFSLLGDPDKQWNTKVYAIEPGDTTTTDTSTTTTSSSSSSSAIYYNALFQVANPEQDLRINMTAQISIVLAEAKESLLIPSTALGKPLGNGWYEVKVQTNDQQLQMRKVRIGLNNRVRAQVLEGLQAGERVVTSEAKAGNKSTNQRGGPPGFF